MISIIYKLSDVSLELLVFHSMVNLVMALIMRYELNMFFRQIQILFPGNYRDKTETNTEKFLAAKVYSFCKVDFYYCKLEIFL